MGYGDEIMATGLARGMRIKGKLAAFGDGRKIVFGPWSEEMFRHNPNIAQPGSEHFKNLEWIAHYKGARMYNKQSTDKKKWIWNYDFKVKPGEFFFNGAERALKNDWVRNGIGDFVVVEPNVPWQKSVAPNKDWGETNFVQLAKRMQVNGIRLVQFIHKNSRRKLDGAHWVEFPTFRQVIAALSLAKLYIGPEGGMHHAAAAVDVPAVVLMGGFIPPAVVGYDNHINLTGNSMEACGNINECQHCKSAMRSISVDQVYDSALLAMVDRSHEVSKLRSAEQV